MDDQFGCRIHCLAAFLSMVVAPVAIAQDTDLISGQNINMVSGTDWPNGDPFLQRQNEPTIAVSTRNEQHLLGGSNDYRTVDIPGPVDGKTIGESWVSAYFSNTGGGRWISNLVPGYPQDGSALGLASPLRQAGYQASADPVIRAGTHGLFYYSGIAFTRSDDPPSAGFVATYMDLNNNEGKNTIGYVGTTLFDQNTDGSSFIDKPWIAVDKPRSGAQVVILNVNTDDGAVVQQTVECGNVYAAYARIQGDGTNAVSSQIMMSRSEDCGGSFSTPVQLSLPDTINQGAAIAVEPLTGRVQVSWRQFENATMSCTYGLNFWKDDPDAWPVNEIEIAGVTYESGDSGSLFPGAKEKGGTPWLVLRRLLAAWLNVLAGADNSAIAETMADAEAWLVEFPPGSKPKKNDKKVGNNLKKALDDYNKGKTGPGSCDDLVGEGMLSGMNPNAIMVVHSDDAGATWSAPVSITGPEYLPFEQGTTEFSFRTTGYPTMTFDGEGRAYVAYSTRGLAVSDNDPVGGDARIVVTTSTDGTSWTTALAIDESSRPGHQFMPALEFSRGKVFLLYYDFREDIAGVFDRFIVDLPVDITIPRHSADVRTAQAIAANVPIFTDYSILDGASTQASRYPFVILDDAGTPISQQMQYNPPNLPMFKGGTVPFFGDYIDIAALRFLINNANEWDFDLDPARGAPVVHAIWTDNRDVVGPLDGDWSSYVPPGDGGGQSIFDPMETVPVCDPNTDPGVIDRTKMRNQNIYTSRLTQGIAFAVPGNNRPLGIIERAFVGFLQNATDEDKLFRIDILNQPSGGSASFKQSFPLEPPEPLVTTLIEVVERQSSIARTIYVDSTVATDFVDISVVEVFDTPGNPPVPGGLAATTRINPDPTAPAPDAGNILNEELYSPAIFNPAVFNPAIFNSALLGGDLDVGIYSPAIFNPTFFDDPENADFIEALLAQLAMLNPAVFNGSLISNPAIFNPAIFNPAVFNPAVFNLTVFNPAIFNISTANPAIFNPAVFNPAIFNSTLVETSVVIRNEGNATAAYSLNLDLDEPPPGFLFQVMVYRTYLVPSVDGCTLTESVEQEALVNEITPDLQGSLLDPESTSFLVAPGDFVGATVRIIPNPANPGNPLDIDTLAELDLSLSIVPQAVDTPSVNAGETEPTPVLILAPSIAPLVTETVITGDADILNSGTLIAANNLGASATARTVSGVAFGIDQSGLSTAFANGGGDFSTDPFSTELDALLSNLVFVNFGLTHGELKIPGLIPGTTYRLQLLFSNDLNTTGNFVDVSVDGGSYRLDDWQNDAINLIVEFTASSSSALITFDAAPAGGAESGRAILNAYALHAAPFTPVAAASYRADFDMSADPVSGPFSCLRTQWLFSPDLGANEILTAQLYDSHHGPVVSNLFIQLPFATNNVGHEFVMSASPSLADGIGHAQIQFTQPINVTSLTVQGQQPCFGSSTAFVTATLCDFDQSYDPAPTGGSSIPGLAPLGQTFTPMASSLNAVDMYMNLPSGGVSGDVFARIRSGSITGAILGTSNSVTVNNLPPSPVERYRFRFATPVAVTPGVLHAIEVVHSSGATVGVWGPGLGMGAYPGGTRVVSGVATPGEDFSFEEGTCSP